MCLKINPGCRLSRLFCNYSACFVIPSEARNLEPKKISCGVWEPFVVSLSNHERFPYTNPFGEHIKTPPTLRLAQGERGFDMLDCVF